MGTVCEDDPLEGQGEVVRSVTKRKGHRISHVFGEKAFGDPFRLQESLNLFSGTGRKGPQIGETHNYKG